MSRANRIIMYKIGSDERPAENKHLKGFEKKLKKVLKKAKKSNNKTIHIVTHHAVTLEHHRLY